MHPGMNYSKNTFSYFIFIFYCPHSIKFRQNASPTFREADCSERREHLRAPSQRKRARRPASPSPIFHRSLRLELQPRV
jgi:hypothetical protein